MTYSSYEKGSSFKSTVTFTSGSIVKDPSGNRVFIEVYKPDGTLMINSSGTRVSTGVYFYWISTQSTDDLGIYRIKWSGFFNQGDPKFTHTPKIEQDGFIVTIVD